MALNAVHGGEPMTTHGSSSRSCCQHLRLSSAFRKFQDRPDASSTIKSNDDPARRQWPLASLRAAVTRGGEKSSVTTSVVASSLMPPMRHNLRARSAVGSCAVWTSTLTRSCLVSMSGTTRSTPWFVHSSSMSAQRARGTAVGEESGLPHAAIIAAGAAGSSSMISTSADSPLMASSSGPAAGAEASTGLRLLSLSANCCHPSSTRPSCPTAGGI